VRFPYSFKCKNCGNRTLFYLGQPDMSSEMDWKCSNCGTENKDVVQGWKDFDSGIVLEGLNEK